MCSKAFPTNYRICAIKRLLSIDLWFCVSKEIVSTIFGLEYEIALPLCVKYLYCNMALGICFGALSLIL